MGYASTKFSTPQEFEKWLEENEHENKSALDKVTEEKQFEWDRKGCKLALVNGKLRLLCKDDNILAEVDMCGADESTLSKNADGSMTVTGIKDKNSGKVYSIWVGTVEQYNAMTVKPPKTLFFKTDDTTLEDILSGVQTVGKATLSTTSEKTNGVVELNEDKIIKLFVGTQAEWNAFTGDKTDVITAFTDDPTTAGILQMLSEFPTVKSDIAGLKNGTVNAGNADKVNNLEIKQDENGVLKIGDIIIPQKKLLWSGEVAGSNESPATISLSEELTKGDTIEVFIQSSGTIRKFKYTWSGVISDVDIETQTNFSSALGLSFSKPNMYYSENQKALIFKGFRVVSIESNGTTEELLSQQTITKIYKIIE